MTATFPEIRIVEETKNWADGTKGLVINRVYIDGKEFHMPVDQEVSITASSEGLVEVNLSFFVSRVVIEETTRMEGRNGNL